MDDFGTIAVVLRTLRAEGIDFDTAWRCAMPPRLARPSRTDTRAALTATEDAWRRAYVGEPPGAGEAACVFLAGLWAEPVEPEPVGEVVASRCG